MKYHKHSLAYEKLMSSRYKKIHPAYRWVYDHVRNNNRDHVEYGYVNLRKDGAVSFKRTSNLNFVWIDTGEENLPYPLLLGGRVVSLDASNLRSLWNFKPSPSRGSPRITISNLLSPNWVSKFWVGRDGASELISLWELEKTDFLPCLVMNDLGLKFYGSKNRPDLEKFLHEHRGAVSSGKFGI